MGKKVAELNTLSGGKGITGVRFFNEMEDTNESTNLRKICRRLDVKESLLSGTSQQKRCQRHSNHC